MPTANPPSPSPLTQLSEEELMFRDAVAGFAEEEVRPRVSAMESASKIDPALIPNAMTTAPAAMEPVSVRESIGETPCLDGLQRVCGPPPRLR